MKLSEKRMVTTVAKICENTGVCFDVRSTALKVLLYLRKNYVFFSVAQRLLRKVADINMKVHHKLIIVVENEIVLNESETINNA